MKETKKPNTQVGSNTECYNALLDLTPKHTPGPWHFHYDGFNQMSIYSDVQTKCGSKAVVNHLAFYKGGEEEQKANARLIAAAPEMFHALQECLAYAKTKGYLDLPNEEQFECFTLVAQVLKKTIFNY